MTNQREEKLLYQGRNFSMTCEPLKEYLSEKSINLYSLQSNCWRGYVGSWEIRDDKLYLLSLKICDFRNTTLRMIFPDYDEKPYHFKQFNGVITFHNGFYQKRLKFKQGCLVSRYNIAIVDKIKKWFC